MLATLKTSLALKVAAAAAATAAVGGAATATDLVDLDTMLDGSFGGGISTGVDADAEADVSTGLEVGTTSRAEGGDASVTGDVAVDLGIGLGG